MSMITVKTIRTISPIIACLAICAAAILLFRMRPALAADAKDKSKTPLTNVNVFDGKSDKLINNANVLAEGNLIKEVSTEKIPADGATVIDVGGRTLIPGLIDTHVQLAINCQYCGLGPSPYLASAKEETKELEMISPAFKTSPAHVEWLLEEGEPL